MTASADIWRMLAGIAIFLLGVGFLEESLQHLSGRRFKLFLKKHTSSPWKAIGGGALVTAILQSSSVVSLMVLAFVGAGIINMQNALAVILGANLGTTFTGWLVAVAGFNFDIESLALPVAGLAGIGAAIFKKGGKWQLFCRLFLGLSFLFIGLGYIKSGFEQLVLEVDVSAYARAPLAVFLLIGFLITSLIQSSSATMAITLSALYAGAISLPDGVAIMLGGEVGTTIKLFIASVNGSAAKRRVALGNFIFNLVTTILVLLFLYPLLRLVTITFGISNPLIALVFFQSLVNVFGIILFYPVLGVFGRFLERRFRSMEDPTLFLHRSMINEPLTALQALEKENHHFLLALLDYTRHCFELESSPAIRASLHHEFPGKDGEGKYEYLKYLHGEIHSYYLLLQQGLHDRGDNEKLSRLLSSVRNTMYAAKSIKDTLGDLHQLKNSSNDTKYHFYCQTESAVAQFCDQMEHLLLHPGDSHFNELVALYAQVTTGYTDILQQLYRDSMAGTVSESEITTMLNFNRGIFSAFQSFLFGVKDYLFTHEQSGYFDDLSGFVR